MVPKPPAPISPTTTEPKPQKPLHSKPKSFRNPKPEPSTRPAHKKKNTLDVPGGCEREHNFADKGEPQGMDLGFDSGGGVERFRVEGFAILQVSLRLLMCCNRTSFVFL